MLQSHPLLACWQVLTDLLSYVILVSHRIVAGSPQVERLIHFSEMGADVNHASRRLASKAQGDALVMQHVPSATIVRWVNAGLMLVAIAGYPALACTCTMCNSDTAPLAVADCAPGLGLWWALRTISTT
jgi:hypothetical protein